MKYTGMRSFGKSAKSEDLFEHFGFTPKNIVDIAKKNLIK